MILYKKLSGGNEAGSQDTGKKKMTVLAKIANSAKGGKNLDFPHGACLFIRTPDGRDGTDKRV